MSMALVSSKQNTHSNVLGHWHFVWIFTVFSKKTKFNLRFLLLVVYVVVLLDMAKISRDHNEFWGAGRILISHVQNIYTACHTVTRFVPLFLNKLTPPQPVPPPTRERGEWPCILLDAIEGNWSWLLLRAEANDTTQHADLWNTTQIKEEFFCFVLQMWRRNFYDTLNWLGWMQVERP